MKDRADGQRSLLPMEWIGRLSLALLVAEVILILASWILSAMMVGGVRSLISGEGIRWFIGSFSEMMASPLLVWMILLLMAGGCLWRSRLTDRHQSYRDRIAFRVALVFLLLYVVVILLLSVLPHAVLLSAAGSLFPSAFSRGLIPALAFALVLVSVSFGVMSGRFRSLGDILDALSFGIRQCAPLFIVYLLLTQFCQSLRFVFG